jgi:Calcineurin-like phosphoesterase
LSAKVSPLFAFVHVPDSHLSETLDVVTPLVESVNTEQFHPRPDFIVFGGDNINGCRTDGAFCEREMPLLKSRLDSLQVPYDIICHNHDTWGEAVRGVQYQRYFLDSFNYTRKLPHGFTAIFMSGQYVENGCLIVNAVDNVSWLEHALSEVRDRKVFLFSHMPLFPPRKPVTVDLEREIWQAYHFGLQADESAPVRDVIAKHGNVIAHYSGHCHVHSVTESAGTCYITTAALTTQPWEYRYVEVYPDRIAHRCILPHKFRNGVEFWTHCLNEDHPGVNIYHDGLPEERDFVICY